MTKSSPEGKKTLFFVLAALIFAGAVFTLILWQHVASYRFRKSFQAFNPIVGKVNNVRDFFPQEFLSSPDNAAVYIIKIDEIVYKPGHNVDSVINAVAKHSDEIIGLLQKASLCDHCDFLAAGLPPRRPLVWNPDHYLLANRMMWGVTRTLLKEATQLAESDRDRAREVMFYLLSLGEHIGGQTLYCSRFAGCVIQRDVCKALAELTKDSDPSQSKTWVEIAEKAEQLDNIYHWKGHQMLGRWHASIARPAKCEINDELVGAMARCAQESNDMNLRLLAIDGLTAVHKLRWWSFPGMQARHVLEEIANNKKLDLVAEYARESLSLPRAEVKKDYRVYSSHAF